jgi:hypothetical protein
MSRVTPEPSSPLTVRDIARELRAAASFERKVLEELADPAVRLNASTHDYIRAMTTRRILALDLAATAFEGTHALRFFAGVV